MASLIMIMVLAWVLLTPVYRWRVHRNVGSEPGPDARPGGTGQPVAEPSLPGPFGGRRLDAYVDLGMTDLRVMLVQAARNAAT